MNTTAQLPAKLTTSSSPTDNVIPTDKTLSLEWPVVLLLIVGACLAFPFDVPLAQYFMSDPFPGELRSLIHKTEFFGHAYGILGIAFTIYLLCEPRRRYLPRVLCTALVAGLASDAVKVLIHRVRPVDFSFATEQATFKGISFLHVESTSQIFDSAFHSFPSAHTATAIAFALALGAVFTKGKRWFLLLAGLCAVSRFDGGAHYVSDTFVGALIGYGAGCWMLGTSFVARRFSAYEQGVHHTEIAPARTQVSDRPKEATPSDKPKVIFARACDRQEALRRAMQS